MDPLLQLYIYIPLAGFLISLFPSRKHEKFLSNLALGTVGLHFLAILLITGYWAGTGFQHLNFKHVVLYHSGHFEFFTNFYFDNITAVYAVLGAFITMSVTWFSKFYMHRDEGFKRFFNTLLFFYLGYSFVIFSGNFETLFIGWEVLGITSFLLISFYRDRYLPVKNGLKVISVYRLGDVCLILSMWLAHHIFHKNITFAELEVPGFIAGELLQHPVTLPLVAVLIVIAVSVKSAQFPFSSWLPRAMEGPTVSSAIFYGSLSVHLGIFLLLRTYPLWKDMPAIQYSLVAIGLLTSVFASSTASVQSTVKTQIAYASATQIGIMFIEVALGFHLLALLHFAGNALLRTYQLLVSPSVLGYRIHDMVFSYTPKRLRSLPPLLRKLQNTLYLLSVKEWHFDRTLYRYLWQPFKWLGDKLRVLDHRLSRAALILLFLSGCVLVTLHGHKSLPYAWLWPELYALLAFLFIIKAFVERQHAIRAWLYSISSQLFIALAILFNAGNVPYGQVFLYLSGILVAAFAGLWCLLQIRAIDDDLSMNYFHGYAQERPGIALLFFIACLTLLGFPVTPTFIGIDLLFTHIETDQYFLVTCLALGFILIEVSVLRIYVRIFLGQYKRANRPIAYRSS